MKTISSENLFDLLLAYNLENRDIRNQHNEPKTTNFKASIPNNSIEDRCKPMVQVHANTMATTSVAYLVKRSKPAFFFISGGNALSALLWIGAKDRSFCWGGDSGRWFQVLCGGECLIFEASYLSLDNAFNRGI